MGIPFSRKTSLLASLALCFSLISAPANPAEEAVRGSWIARAVSVPASEVIDRDFFAAGPVAAISGTVNGDVYAFGGQVLVDGTVNGDLLVAGGRVSVSGTVAQDVRVAGGQVSLSGTIGRNITAFGGNVEVTRSAAVKGGVVAAGGNIHLAGPVARSAKIAAGSLIVSNKVGGTVDAAVGTLRITSNADIAGDVNYLSSREAAVDPGARIGGKFSRTAPPKVPTPEKIGAFFVAVGIFVVAISFVSTLVLGLLSVRFLPNYHRAVVNVVRERPWASLGIGFIAAVVTPVALLIVFATVLGIPIGLIFAAAYFILLYWGRLFVLSRIGEAIFGLFRANPGPGWVFVVGLVIYYLLALIPLIGWLAVTFVVLVGLGAELVARKEFYVLAKRQGMI